MTISNESHITLKIKRAKQHVDDLDRQIRIFLDSDPYRVRTKPDTQSPKTIYYLATVEPTPECLPLIAGDVVQNLMSALDHLAYQLVVSDTGGSPPNPNWIYFPIADDAAKYEAKKRGKIEGASDETIKAIDALKPYKGGNDLLWALYRLNNIEKHRLLITVGSIFHSVNVGAHVTDVVQQAINSVPALAGLMTVPDIEFFVKPKDGLFPLKAGDVVFIDTNPKAKFNPKMKFRFSVALYEPEIIEAQPLLETLHQLTTLVEGIVSALICRVK